MAEQENFYKWEEEYRDTIGTVDAEGKRIWVYPKKPKGKLHNLRIVVTIILLGLLFTGPFLEVNGHPMFLFNIFEREFIIFGVKFWPQDFYLLGLGMISLFVFIIMFTVVFGRIWCGWACPQTLFMEMVFRKIEYWIEGDANKQRKLDQAPWTQEKILKKGLKHIIFIAIAVLIAHTLMAYLIGLDNVIEVVSNPPAENLAGFLGTVAFTGIFYWVFSYFREQACIAVCPYGRLQGVLLGKESIAVMYDWLRGEPRGRLKKGEVVENNGDCIECKLCVHACPTGIDIRNGTQLECVNCTACIDACDSVMDRIGKPRGLIRYASYNSIIEGAQSLLTGRVLGYSIVLLILVSVLGFSIANRSDIEATIVRVPGTIYEVTEDDKISNLYQIQFINKTYDAIDLKVRLLNAAEGSLEKAGSESLTVEAGMPVEGIYIVKLPRSSLKGMKTELEFGLYNGDELIDTIETNFIGPSIINK